MISTAERKLACRDKDKLRRRETRLEGSSTFRRTMHDGSRANRTMRSKSDERERPQKCVHGAKRKCQQSLWEPTRPKKKPGQQGQTHLGRKSLKQHLQPWYFNQFQDVVFLRKRLVVCVCVGGGCHGCAKEVISTYSPCLHLIADC